MTYIIVSYGEGDRMIANADCMVRVLLDWLQSRLASYLSSDGDWLLDLWDSEGSLRLLSALPPASRALLTLQPGRVYHAVARRQTVPGDTFQPVGRAAEPPAELARCLLRGELCWELAALQLESADDAEARQQAVLQALEAAASSTATSLGRQLARLGREARSERISMLETRLRPAAGRGSRAAPSNKKRHSARSGSTLSNKSTDSRASTPRPSLKR